jgi:hypothetical protein
MIWCRSTAAIFSDFRAGEVCHCLSLESVVTLPAGTMLSGIRYTSPSSGGSGFMFSRRLMSFAESQPLLRPIA